MKLYAPEYYKEFICIADKCKHSCCIGWEIDIDAVTMQKYQNLSHNYSKEILKSIEPNEIPHFKLACGDRCPHLNQFGLCDIILNVGEGYLCDICREHPRFYNYASNRKEVGIGMACEEACRIILNSDKYASFAEIAEVDDEVENIEFNAILHRQKLYEILSHGDLTYNEKLNSIYEDYQISPHILSNEQWHVVIDNLEYLNESHKSLFLQYCSNPEIPFAFEKNLERALAYFIFRHCSESCDEDEFKISLGFCLFCERLLASLIKDSKAIDEVINLARIVSEEIEYSQDNTDSIKFEFSFNL